MSEPIPQSAGPKAPGPAGRRPGRRPADGNVMDRDSILQRSLQLTKTVPLADLSIVRVARELGVTPALIHYYLGGRDPLTSGVMNAFYKHALEAWPEPRDDWAENLKAVAASVYDSFLAYPGVVAYLASHNRYRVVQDVEEGEADFGILHFERFNHAVQRAGFDALRSAAFGHMLMNMITSSAHDTVAHRWPSQHRAFLGEKLAKLDKKSFPSVHFVRKSLTMLDPALAFEMSLDLFLQSLRAELDKPPPSRKSPARKAL